MTAPLALGQGAPGDTPLFEVLPGRGAGHPTAYGCTVSTLAPEGAGHRYRYGSLPLRFAPHVVQAAGGRTRHVTFVLGSDSAPPWAGSAEGREGVVRLARCVVPAAEGVERAVRARLAAFGSGSWAGERLARGGFSAGGDAAAGGGSSAEGDFAATSGEWACREWFVTRVCLMDPETGDLYNCQVTYVECVEWTYVSEDSGGGSGGGDPIGGGDEPDPCYPEPGGGVPIGCGGGGGDPQPPGPDPCLDSDPPAYCTNPCETGDPIIDHIGVQVAFERLWQQSNYGAPMAERQERGGWVTFDAQTGEYGFVEFPSNWGYLACSIVPITYPPGSVRPPAGAIAFVHTHPFQKGDMLSACYDEPLIPGTQLYPTYNRMPSGPDILTIGNLKASGYDVKGYVIDNDGITANDEMTNPRIGVEPQPVFHNRCGF